MDIQKTDHNLEKIKRIVSQIMANRTPTKPYDFLFRDNINHYPKTNHKLLKLPGIFKKKENTTVFVKDGRNLEMDYAESVLPDGGMIERESAINLEQETGKLKEEKAKIIFEYCLNTTILLKKPCYPFVATNYEYKTDYLKFCIEGFILIIYLRVFDKKRVYKILNTLTKKDYINKGFSIEDHVLFKYCMIFAKKPYAQDVIEKLAILFTSIENINIDYQYDLFASICMMIKYHFDNEEKICELITMITKSMNEEELESLPYIERTKIELAESEKKCSDLTNELSKKDNELSQKEEELSKKDNELSQKEEEISKKDNELSKKDEKIAKLEALLISNNIVF